MWSLGDYTRVAQRLEPYAKRLADACQIASSQRVLDVAAGNGNFAVAAAERGATVTASDSSPRMLELGRARTAALDIAWSEGDAEGLPFPDASFDVVASVFGAMFAPRPERVARELFRVCRPGGLVAMANYSPDGFLGGITALFGRFSTPLPFALPSPFEWGQALVVRERLGGFASTMEIDELELTMTFDTVPAAVDFWEETNAPMVALRMRLTPEQYAACRRELAELMAAMSRPGGSGIELSNAYVQVLARKPG